VLIAHRCLTISGQSGEMEVPVRLFVPKENDHKWICRYEIDWPNQKKVHWASGIDSIQAITLALQMIGAEIYTSAYHKSGSLKWSKQADGYGFPVTRNIRDLLVGDDVNL
jgi:hypothetical protein